MQALRRGVYTVTSGKSTVARGAWWEVRAKRRGLEAFPLDTQKLQLAGALLKKGHYRSAAQYLYSLKKEHAVRGHGHPMHNPHSVARFHCEGPCFDGFS